KGGYNLYYKDKIQLSKPKNRRRNHTVCLLSKVSWLFGRTTPFPYKYGYDKKGRLNMYRDCLSNEFRSISYPSYGELVKRFNATTNQLIAESVNTITQAGQSTDLLTTTITTPESQVIISKRKSNKNLVDMITVVENSSFPEIKYYQITYK
ncbi:MAG TPA: hypothetical protein VGB71_13520, partial [Flavisolibacter sp.]